METIVNAVSPILSAAEMQQCMKDEHLVIVDAQSGPDATKRYAALHVKGAVHVDLEKDLAKIPADAALGGRHPLPDINDFAMLLGKLGITPASRVIVYDDKQGANAAARFWWMLRATGHRKVQVLDGGLQAAIKAAIPVTDERSQQVHADKYPVSNWVLPIAGLETVKAASNNPDKLIIDVREGYRYRGEHEPIDLVAGHIPNAINIPYLENLDDDGNFLDSGKLATYYHDRLQGHEPKDIIVHCGSGVTACHTLLALEQAGMRGANLYVGSWSEWSRNPLPIAKGDASKV